MNNEIEKKKKVIKFSILITTQYEKGIISKKKYKKEKEWIKKNYPEYIK